MLLNTIVVFILSTYFVIDMENTQNQTVIVVVDGGLVTGIYTDAKNISVEVIDLDELESIGYSTHERLLLVAKEVEGLEPIY